MSRSSSISIGTVGNASDQLIDFIAGDEPLSPSSSDGVEPALPGWFNAGRVMVGRASLVLAKRETPSQKH